MSGALEQGDVISIDCGAIVDGWHGDAAITVAVGDVPAEVTELMTATEEAMWRGIAAARLGGRVTDISHAVETHLRSRGRYGILEDYVGHGIGSEMHQPPNVPNFGRPGRGPKLVQGLALAVEPMVTLGGKETVVLDDDWTVVTADGSWAAHFEHTFTLTPDGAVGADRAGRWRGGARRARRALRRVLSRSRHRTDSRRLSAAWDDERRWRGVFPRSGVVSTARTSVRPGSAGSTEGAGPRSSGRDLRRQNSSAAPCRSTTTAIRRRSP